MTHFQQNWSVNITFNHQDPQQEHPSPEV